MGMQQFFLVQAEQVFGLCPALQPPSQLSPGCRPAGCAQQSQTGCSCNVSSGPAEMMVLPLEKKLV